MELLPGEAKLSESNDGTVVLTSRRIRLDQGQGRGRQFVSIPLNQVASCSMSTRAYPFLLLFAALWAIAAFQFAGERMATMLLAVGAGLALLCVILYFVTREQLITISSAGEAIRIRTKGLSRSASIQFIDDVERAQLRLGSPPAH
jgi:hypothetical protein